MASTGETKTSTSSSSTAEEKKERIIKLKRKIDSDMELIKQIKDDIAKMDDNTEEGKVVKKAVTDTLDALVEELKKDEAQEQLLELTQQKKKGALSGFDKKLKEDLEKTSKQGGRRCGCFCFSSACHYILPKDY